MTELFDKCIEVVLKHEGGYVWDKDDLGGETNFGIAKRYFPEEDIKRLTVERAKMIYLNYYWLPMSLDGMADESALEIFDHGVNAGKRTSIRMAQNMIGVVADGIMGPITREAVTNCDRFVESFKDERIIYYARIAYRRPKNRKFLRGWLNRVESTHF